MADTAPLLPGLPDEIAIWEILVRLPPKSLLRSRAVSPAWRRATSTHDFLLSHHARQPALPLLYSRSDLADGGVSLDIAPFDHRAAGVAADADADRLQSVARLKTPPHEEALPCFTPRFYLEASCDGLLLLSIDSDYLSICSPATRQYAPLHQLDGFVSHGMYPHPSTAGDYRLLLSQFDEDQLAMYVFTIGSAQPPRRIGIGCPEPPDCAGLLFKGSLYWYTGSEILVFDTSNESFRQISSPFSPDYTGYAQLFETGGMLGIFDQYIFVMQNHQSEDWKFKSLVRLPVAETRQHCQCSDHRESVMVVPGDGGLLILLKCGAWLFQVDADGERIVHGKLIASFHCSGIMSNHYLLKQTLVQHTFFPTLEGYVVNAPPFI